jgi:serine protease
LLALKACDATGVCEEADVGQAIRYAADRRADVINLSIGLALVRPRLDGRLQIVLDAITYATKKGAVVIAAAGNLTLPICQEPAASSVCVGATDRDDLRTFYSNGDSTLTARYLVAPGGGGFPSVTGCENEIVSTFPTDLPPSSCSVGGGYAGLSGTSMAAPFVSGVAALLAAEGLDGPEIVERLLATADDLGAPGRDPVFGYGRVSALRAVLNI